MGAGAIPRLATTERRPSRQRAATVLLETLELDGPALWVVHKELVDVVRLVEAWFLGSHARESLVGRVDRRPVREDERQDAPGLRVPTITEAEAEVGVRQYRTVGLSGPDARTHAVGVELDDRFMRLAMEEDNASLVRTRPTPGVKKSFRVAQSAQGEREFKPTTA